MVERRTSPEALEFLKGGEEEGKEKEKEEEGERKIRRKRRKRKRKRKKRKKRKGSITSASQVVTDRNNSPVGSRKSE